MDRPNKFADKPQAYINKLFNNIQKCRVDFEIIKNDKNYILDDDIVKAAEALARDMRYTYNKNKNI